MPEPIGVMLVDDEILAIEDLQQLIPWEEHGFKIIATATSSRKALELYAEQLPQIILADIRMPVMDGLELSRRVMAYGNPVRIILLTAYKEFEYAKQAVAIGVANYLLKHDLNEATLIKELAKARNDLETEFRRNHLLRQQCIRKLFDGESLNDWGDYSRLGLVRPKTERLGLLLVQGDRPCLDEFHDQSRALAQLKVDWSKLDYPAGVQWVEAYDCNDRMLVLADLKKTNSHLAERDCLHQLALKLNKELNTGEQQSFSIIITRGAAAIKELPLAVQRLMVAQDFLVFYGRERILHYEDLPLQSSLSHLPMPAPIQTLARSIHNWDTDEVGRFLDELFQPALTFRDPERFKGLCRQLFSLLEGYRQQHGLPSLQQLYQEGQLTVNSLYYAPEIVSWFKEHFASSLHSVRNGETLKYSRKVRQALEYIQANYSKDLTVEAIAAPLGISGVYLSQLFKKETNRTVLEYLTEYRIKVAKVLLEKGDYKIYEVAAMVGYKTSQYFSKVFQKVTGTYPLGYKEGEGRHEAGN